MGGRVATGILAPDVVGVATTIGQRRDCCGVRGGISGSKGRRKRGIGNVGCSTVFTGGCFIGGESEVS